MVKSDRHKKEDVNLHLVLCFRYLRVERACFAVLPQHAPIVTKHPCDESIESGQKHQATHVFVKRALSNTLRKPLHTSLEVVFEVATLLHVSPLEPSCPRLGCHDDRDIPRVCLTKHLYYSTSSKLSLSFRRGVTRQRWPH